MTARRAIAIIAGLAVAAVLAATFLGQGGDDGLQGYVEGDFLLVGPEDSGRIAEVTASPGDRVEAGDGLFALDASTARTQRREAEARLSEARATLANLQSAQQRPEQVAVLQAALERARAAVNLSQTELERQRLLFERGHTAKAALDQAEATYESDAASLEEAKRQIAAAELTGRSSEIDAAAAGVKAAEAALALATEMVERRRVTSPQTAVVEDVLFRTGEVVSAGQAVVSLLPDANRKVRFYVPEPKLAAATIGTSVAVDCDGCDGPHRGTITFLSSDAEYTPPVIFSESERAKLVFRAEARLDDSPALPVGLPVTVRIAGEAR